jgi:serine/threonine protein phosphatase 1
MHHTFEARVPEAPPGVVAFALGDVHGRDDLLEVCVDALISAAATTEQQVVAIFLGDYVDRGPDSCAVLERLIAFRQGGYCQTRFLRGNHEQVLLDIIDGVDDGRRWLRFGGFETLTSYRGAPPSPEDLRAPHAVQTMILNLMPQSHVDYVFVHAGLRPDRLLAEQTTEDMLWLRYDDERPVHAKTVVHGHTVNAAPVLGRYRIGIDTHAHASGALTMLRLEGAAQDFLRISRRSPAEPGAIAPWPKLDAAFRSTEGAPRGRCGPPAAPVAAGLVRSPLLAERVGGAMRWLRPRLSPRSSARDAAPPPPTDI